MAQEIVTWCDRHMDNGEREPGEPRRLAFGTGPVQVIDLCEPCWKELAAPLADFVRDFGRRDDGKPQRSHKAAPTPAPTPSKRGRKPTQGGPLATRSMKCPICSRMMMRQRLRDHLPNAHQTTLSAVETELGTTLEGEPLPFECGVCHQRFPGGAGRSSHARGVHSPGEYDKAMAPRAT